MMESYQRADIAQQEQAEEPLRLLKEGAYTGAAIYGGASLLGRAMPLLSRFVPEGTAIKGLSKIDPRLGKFVKNGLNAGYTFNEIKDFIGQKFEEEKKPKDNRNIIEQYSPELHQYILGEMQKGRSPLEAGALASIQDTFKDSIKKITKDHKAPFASIIETIYGKGKSPQPEEGLGRESLMKQFNQGQQQGQGKQALLSTMQEITEALRRMRGNG